MFWISLSFCYKPGHHVKVDIRRPGRVCMTTRSLDFGPPVGTLLRLMSHQYETFLPRRRYGGLKSCHIRPPPLQEPKDFCPSIAGCCLQPKKRRYKASDEPDEPRAWPTICCALRPISRRKRPKSSRFSSRTCEDGSSLRPNGIRRNTEQTRRTGPRTRPIATLTKQTRGASHASSTCSFWPARPRSRLVRGRHSCHRQGEVCALQRAI
jgi:hypothetical protein